MATSLPPTCVRCWRMLGGGAGSGPAGATGRMQTTMPVGAEAGRTRKDGRVCHVGVAASAQFEKTVVTTQAAGLTTPSRRRRAPGPASMPRPRRFRDDRGAPVHRTFQDGVREDGCPPGATPKPDDSRVRLHRRRSRDLSRRHDELQFHPRTDPGLARENNEDSVAVDDASRWACWPMAWAATTPARLPVAWRPAFIKSEMGRWLAEAGPHANAKEVRRALEICVDNANRSIFNAANSNPQYSGMGTTLVVGVFQDTRLMLGHIGDSRCYRLRGGSWCRSPRTIRLLQEQIDAGLITPEQAADVEQEPGDPRAGRGGRRAARSQRAPGRGGDCYLMCSDGLSDMVDDAEIASILGGLCRWSRRRTA
jgi:hypothetical protein